MIRISVDTEEELKIVRNWYLKPAFCYKISREQCLSMPECEQCVRDIAPKYIQVTMRKVIDEPQELVI